MKLEDKKDKSSLNQSLMKMMKKTAGKRKRDELRVAHKTDPTVFKVFMAKRCGEKTNPPGIIGKINIVALTSKARSEKNR